MTDDRLLDSLNASSLFDTYLLYGIVGLLIFVALIGLVVLLVTSCCCFYPISSCCCCCYHRRHRHSSYKLNSKAYEDTIKIAFVKRQSSNLTELSQLYDSCPHLINDRIAKATTHLQTSCTTINTLLPPASPCNSLRSFNRSVLPVSHHLNLPFQKIHTSIKDVGARPFAYIKSPHDQTHISQRVNRSISPTVVSIDMARKSTSEKDGTHSPSTNIYETVTLATAHVSASPNRSTPIYESDWTNNIKKLMTELPLSPPDLVPSFGYFQQQDPYHKVLANRIKTSDSMRRANMLKRLKDDAAFLY